MLIDIFLDWLLGKWGNLRDILETSWDTVYNYIHRWVLRIRQIVEEWYGRLLFYVEVWYDTFAAVLPWYRTAFVTFFTSLYNTVVDFLSRTWGWLWERFATWVKEILTYLQPVWTRVKDFFTNLYLTVKDFLSRVWEWLWEHFPEWLRTILTFLNEVRLKVIEFFTDLYIRVKDFLSRIWEWLWEHFPLWLREIILLLAEVWEKVKDFFINLYHQVRDFLSRVWEWIWEHVPLILREVWGFLVSRFVDLVFLFVDAWKEFVKFLTDPFGYITTLLTAWIRLWVEFILGIVGDLLELLMREIVLHLMDWMGYVTPPIERLDEEVEYFSPFTDFLEEGARAWRELEEDWVLEAMEMMEALAMELKGEEEMVPKLPSQIFWENWWLLPDETRVLIGQPPIKA